MPAVQGCSTGADKLRRMNCIIRGEATIVNDTVILLVQVGTILQEKIIAGKIAGNSGYLVQYDIPS